MTWTRISDDFPDRPAILRLSRSARMLHIEGQVYANKHGTDGRIPTVALPRITDSDSIERDTSELIAGDLWRLDGDEWVVDMSDQEPAAVVRGRKDEHARRQKRYRDRKAMHDGGDHSDCDPRFCRQVTRNVTRHETNNETGRVTPPPSTQTRPVPKETGPGRRRCPNNALIADDGTCCGLSHEAAS